MGDFLSQNPLLVLIGACEIGFWVLLGAGLAARYLLRLRGLSTVLLLAVPVLDVVLVSASLLDVAGGSSPGATHGLAAVYLGFTVAFGHATIRWIDVRFAHRFAAGPPPVKPPRYGAAKVAREWREWVKIATAWCVAAAVMVVTSLVAGTGIPMPAQWPADPMWNWAVRVGVVVAIWFAAGPVFTTIAPPRAPRSAEEPADVGRVS
jgi:hypothetical protein